MFLFIGVFSPRADIAWAGYFAAVLFSYWFLYILAFNKSAPGLYYWFLAFMMNTWFFAGVISVYLLQTFSPDPDLSQSWRQTDWLGMFAVPVESLRAATGMVLDAAGGVVFNVSLLSCTLNLLLAAVFYLLFRYSAANIYRESTE